VSAGTDATVRAGESTLPFDFEAVFHAHYRRIARVIVRVIQDPSRAVCWLKDSVPAVIPDSNGMVSGYKKFAPSTN